jgi:hypothetical protein
MRHFLFHVGLALAMTSWSTSTILAEDRDSKAKPAAKPNDKKPNDKKGKPIASGKSKAPAKQVDMFSAMDEGLITVEYIGKDATQANVIFRNRSEEPLDVALPEVFGAVPVLQQGMGGGMGGMGGGMGGMGGGMGGMGGGMGGGGMGGGGMGGGQGMGGGFGGGGGMGGGGMGGGMGGMGGGMGGMGGGGMMRVEPDRPRKLTVATVCLEHGKPDPNPRMKYKIVRLSEVNPKAEVAELCKSLANGLVSQNIAQAAAWHIANGLSWQELAAKPRMISEYTGIEYYFSPVEIQNALRLTSMVTIAAENTPQYESPGTSSPTEGTVLLQSPGERKGK